MYHPIMTRGLSQAQIAALTEQERIGLDYSIYRYDRMKQLNGQKYDSKVELKRFRRLLGLPLEDSLSPQLTAKLDSINHSETTMYTDSLVNFNIEFLDQAGDEQDTASQAYIDAAREGYVQNRTKKKSRVEPDSSDESENNELSAIEKARALYTSLRTKPKA